MSTRLDKVSLSQQMALVAAGMCLLVSIALVGLAAVSSQHMQLSQQEAFGSALARQVARQVGTTLETGDLLSVAASLQRFVQTSSAEEVAVFDVEGKALGQAGSASGEHLQHYRADVRIENDIAGQVVITVSNDRARATQQRLILSLSGLAVLLSVLVFGVTRHLGQRLSDRLAQLSQKVSLEDAPAQAAPANELSRLEVSIDSLPMDLLRTRSSNGPSDDNYRTTAVLYLHLNSLADYVDTVDQASLLRYTHRLHRVIYAAAGFYSGELHVVRQFGLALYFCGHSSAGSPAFRAASCAWLIQAVCRHLEQKMSLSMSLAQAIGESELGAGDETDIYPGLYIQHTLDELQALCASKPPKVLLSPAICEDVDIEGRLIQHATELRDYGMLDEFAAPYQDLLERQLRLIIRRLGAEG